MNHSQSNDVCVTMKLTGGIPFAVTLPKVPDTINTDLMSNDEIHTKLTKGYRLRSMLPGRKTGSNLFRYGRNVLLITEHIPRRVPGGELTVCGNSAFLVNGFRFRPPRSESKINHLRTKSAIWFIFLRLAVCGIHGPLFSFRSC